MADTKVKKIRPMFLTRGPTYVEGEDIADIVQSEVDDQREVVLPEKYFTWSELVTTPYRSGGAIIGAGRSDLLVTTASSKSGLATRIQCTGNALTSGALKLRGSEFELRNITLLGAVPHPTLPPAQASGDCINVSNDPYPDGGGGLGSGKHDLHGVGIYGWTTGVQFGDDSDEDGVSNDHCNLRRCSFRNNAQCLWFRNTQSMGTVVAENQFRHENTYSVRVSSGGHQMFRDCLVTHGQTFFYFDGTNNNSDTPPKEKYRTGRSNALHTVENLKVDTQHAGGFQMIETTNINYADVHFIRPQVSGTDAWTIGNIDDGMTLTITDPSFQTQPTQFTVSALPA